MRFLKTNGEKNRSVCHIKLEKISGFSNKYDDEGIWHVVAHDTNESIWSIAFFKTEKECEEYTDALLKKLDAEVIYLPSSKSVNQKNKSKK